MALNPRDGLKGAASANRLGWLGWSLCLVGAVFAQRSELESDLTREWRLRAYAVNPEATQENWESALDSPEWVRRYDVLEALARTPESAWFALERGVLARASLDSGRTSLKSAERALRLRVEAQGAPIGEAADLGGPPWIGEDREALVRLEWQRVFVERQSGPTRCATWIETLLAGRAEITETEWSLIGPGLVLGAAQLPAAAGRLLQQPGGRLSVERLQALQPSLLEGPVSAEFLKALRDLCRDDSDRFAVAGLELGQVALGISTQEPDLTSLEAGLKLWNPDPALESRLEWVLRKRQFVAELARLGQVDFGRLLWKAMEEVPRGWDPASLEALGGAEGARRDLLEWAAESLPVAESLERGLALSREPSEWLLDALLLRLGEAPLGALKPWLDHRHPVGVRLTAFSAVDGLEPSPERTLVLLALLHDSEEELVRRALRSLAMGPLDASRWAAIEEAWLKWTPDQQERLLRELPTASLSPRLRKECQAALLRDFDREGVWIDAVADGEPSPESWAVLQAGFIAEFERCREFWSKGTETSTNRLAHWVRALLRTDPVAMVPLVGPRLLERIAVFVQPESRPQNLEFCKQAIVALGASVPGRAWLRPCLAEASAWPLRLRVEVALQLCGYANEETDTRLEAWLVERVHEDYEQLGSVLRERLLTALGTRPGPLWPIFASEAQNPRAHANVRRAAMQALWLRRELDPLLQVLASERAGEGVRLVAECLAKDPDPRIAALLRVRIAQTGEAILAEQGNTELAQELLVSLQLALLEGGHFGAADERLALLGPNRMALEALGARFLGEGEPERWPLEISLCQALAKGGHLAGFLDRHAERWVTLPGPLLVSIAQAAFEGEDRSSALRLARLAEAGLSGEAPGSGWLRSRLTLEWLRFQWAWQAQDWPRVQWYALVWLEHHGQGGPEGRFFEAVFGGFDLRLGRNPAARLRALWWQAQAYQLGRDQPEARAAMRRAAEYCGGSRAAILEQARLEAWLDKDD